MIQPTRAAVDIGIVVADLEAQQRFYGEALGLRYAGQLPLPGGEVHVYLAGEALIKLYRYHSATPKPRPAKLEEFGTIAGLAYFTFTVDDLDSAFESLQGHGVKVLSPPNDFLAERDLGPPIGRMHARFALVADADGNMIELFQYVEGE